MGGDSFAYFCFVLMIVGLLVVAAGYLWLFTLAFGTGVWWGLGCLFLPFVSLYFAAQNWRVAKWPVGTVAAGFAATVAGFLLFPRVG